MSQKERFKKTRKLCAKFSHKFFGFTLAELLVILLISSVIMVVLAPIVRKKDTGATGATSTTKYNSVLYDYLTTDSQCTTTDANGTTVCNFKVPKSVKFINAVLVSGGGGGAGATNPNISSGNSEMQTASSQKSIDIIGGMQNVVITYLSGGGGGGGGGAYKQEAGAAPTSQADCDKYDAKYLTASQNNGKAVCVTKYNIGDIPSATNGGIASSVTTVSVDSNCSANSCCWQGNTSGTYCDSSGTSYSGCNRTVCTWYAANASCTALAYNGTKAGDWRLPTKDEMAAWNLNISAINTNQGDNGLRLCDQYRDGAAKCFSDSDRCRRSGSSSCHPSDVWSVTPNGSYYYYYFLGSGTFNGPYNSYPTPGFSARCVLEGGGVSLNSISGGGGSGAPYFKNYTIPQSVIDANIGGKIILYAGAAGAGKGSASSSGASGTNGADGTESYIYIYDSSNTLKWGLKTPGGNGGKGASSTAGGSGGSEKAVTTCQLYNGSSWVSTTCTGAGAKGNNGQVVSGASSTVAAVGGTGGGSLYAATTAGGGGTGGSSSNQNGSAASRYGAGGGGATVRFDSSNNAIGGTGGNGSNGIAAITYDTSSEAAAGGGGAGGSYAFIENIPVIPEKIYQIIIGGGGTGGSSNMDGTDGGATSLSYEGGTYTINGGSGGKKGTSGTGASLIQGIGGIAGTTNIPSKFVKSGSAGKSGQYTADISSGGNGGKSGINTVGGCGGFSSSDECANVASQGKNLNYTRPAELYSSKQFGAAGAGGGGGGWKMAVTSDSGPGGGAPGQNGYVYIYWIENE